MVTTDAQVRRLMEEMARHGNLSRAAMRAAMDRKTARKYVEAGRLASQLGRERTWRTREDPFGAHWAELAERLRLAPELEAKTLFEDLCRRHPGCYREGQLRTLQRRIRRWRAQQGPAKEVFFSQLHRPGEAMQTDFTWASGLGVTIGGEPFSHMLCHSVLPYLNWEWATVCFSESLAALKHGVQTALVRLGRVPRHHQTDNTTAATHELRTGGRGFHREYEEFCRHYGIQPRTIAVGKKEQNGDAESLHGALKRRLEQHLLLRGSRDFETVAAYGGWLEGVLREANRLREARLGEELAAMRPLQLGRIPEYSVVDVRVKWGATIRVRNNTYSVSSRLIGERVRVRLYEDRLEVDFAGERELVVERLRGEGKHRIHYRHVIHSLVRKPGAFERYPYREDLFPTRVFREAYDRLRERLSPRQADLHSLRLLKLAADTLEREVEAAVNEQLGAGALPTVDAVRERVRGDEPPEVPDLEAPGSISPPSTSSSSPAPSGGRKRKRRRRPSRSSRRWHGEGQAEGECSSRRGSGWRRCA